MGVCSVIRADWTCQDCGQTLALPTWEAVDCSEREDLVERLVDATLLRRSCECGGHLHRTSPLLVLGLHARLPVALGIGVEQPDAAQIEDLSARIWTKVASRRSEFPGPMIWTSMSALALAASRDLGADIRALANPEVVMPPDYLELLHDIAATDEARRLELVAVDFGRCRSHEDLDDLLSRAGNLDLLELADVVVQRTDPTVEPQPLVASLALDLREMDVADAWRRHEERVLAFARGRIEQLDARVGSFLSAEQRGAGAEEVLAAGRLALLEAEELLQDDVAAEIRFELARLLCTLPGDREQQLREASALYEDLLDQLDHLPRLDTGARRATVLLNLGSSYASRLTGDTRQNQRRAVGCFEHAVALPSDQQTEDTRAVALTNLGLSLVELGDLDGAIERLKEAVALRDLGVDPVGFAFSHLNLGNALAKRGTASSDERDLLAALEHARQTVLGGRRAGNAFLEAIGLHNEGSQALSLAPFRTDSSEWMGDLQYALESAMAALGVWPDPNGTDTGHTWGLVGDVHLALGELADATEAYKAALERLGPQTHPRLGRQYGRRLAEIAEHRGEDDIAANAWLHSALCALACSMDRSSAHDRLAESREDLTLYRFASVALARAGRGHDAAAIAELGRARELKLLARADGLDIDELLALDPQLADRIISLRSALSSLANLDAADEEAERTWTEWTRAIQEVRKLPGFESAFHDPPLRDLAHGISPDRPVALIVAAPTGVVTHVVSSADPCVELLLTTELTSASIAESLVGGDAGVGYLVAQTDPDVYDLDAEIDLLGATLGELVLRPLAAELKRRQATGCSLVATGLMGLLPLHAIEWRDAHGANQCLLDLFDIDFAPSLEHVVASRRRAATQPDFPRLLVVADPTEDLPHAELEALTVEAVLGVSDTEVLCGPAATRAAVAAALPLASHIHFACHAEARLADGRLTAALELADGPLTASTILASRPLHASLVVLSACETAIQQDYESLEEVLSLSTAFVGAGAGSAVATLWAVDDWAAALLMTRLYEGLQTGLRPARALRDAQLWIRDAEMDDMTDYAARRSHLASLRSARARLGGSVRNAPTDWAAFTVTGG